MAMPSASEVSSVQRGFHWSSRTLSRRRIMKATCSCAAGTCQRFLDQRGGVVAHAESVGGAGGHGDAARLSQLEGRGGVFGGEDLFDGGFRGAVVPDDLDQFPVDAGQTRRKVLVRALSAVNDAAAVQMQDAGTVADDSPAHEAGAGVYAENCHHGCFS